MWCQKSFRRWIKHKFPLLSKPLRLSFRYIYQKIWSCQVFTLYLFLMVDPVQKFCVQLICIDHVGLLGIQAVFVPVDYEVVSWYLNQNRLKQITFLVNILTTIKGPWYKLQYITLSCLDDETKVSDVPSTEGPRLTRFLGLWKNRVTWNSC